MANFKFNVIHYNCYDLFVYLFIFFNCPRFVLFGLVALNVYFERLICKSVLDGDNPGYQQMVRVLKLIRKTLLI